MSNDAILFLHLAGAFLFVGGSITAAVLRFGAMRRERPSEIALLMRAVRPAVPVVGCRPRAHGGGGLLARGPDRLRPRRRLAHLDLRAARVAGGVGAVAGRQDRHTRELAERLAADGDVPSEELSRRLRDPLNLLLNASMLAAIVAIVALMVWKP